MDPTGDPTGAGDGVGPDVPARERLAVELDRARTQLSSLDFDGALRRLDRLDPAIDAVADPSGAADLRVQWLLTRAGVAAELDDDDLDASALLDRAEELCAARDLSRHRVRLAAQRGFLQHRAGDDRAALATLAPLSSELDRAPAADAVKVLLNRGILHMDIGSLAQAETDFRDALDRATAAGMVVQAQFARHNLGLLEYLRGDLPAALGLVGIATALQDGDVDDERLTYLGDPVALKDRALVLAEAGLVDDAEDLLQRAIVRLERDGRLHDEGEARMARARVALLAGDLGVALEEAEAAVDCFVRHGNARWGRSAELVRLAALVEQAQAADRDGRAPDVAGLRADIDAFVARAEGVADHSLAVPTRLMAAEVALVAGDLPAVRAHLDDIDPAAFGNISVRLRWYRVRAELALRAGDGVQEVVATGIDELAQAQGLVGSLDVRTALAIHGRELAAIGVEEALGGGDDATIHVAVERAKASSTRLARVQTVLDPLERDLVGRLRRAGDALERAERDRLGDESDEHRREVREVMARLRTLGHRRSAGDLAMAVADLPTVLDALANQRAQAVTYVRRVDGSLSAVVLGARGLRVVPLGAAAEVEELVARVRSDLSALHIGSVPGPIRRVMVASLRTGLRALDARILGPLGLVEDAEVVVVPAGPLAVAPWTLLPSRRGRATSVAPCLSAWQRACAQRRSGTGVVAIAGPELDRATAEVAAVAGAWPGGAAWSGPDATVQRVRHALGDQRVVHLAMHGRHRQSSPLFSSLTVADGRVFAHELTGAVTSDLVLLSACEVGSVTMREGDEPLGMTAALLQAGAGTVIAGVTPVRDDVAHDTMIDLHRHVVAGASPAAALGRAAAAAWEDGAVAPFTCAGVGVVPLVDRDHRRA